jgi:phosphinothricin acetyltransferase
MTPAVIRPATPSDIPAVTAIYAHAVLHGTASFEIDPPGLAEMERRYGTLVDGGFPYLAAEAGGSLLGYAYAGPYRPRPAYRFTLEDSVYVAPDAQRRGTGRLLLAALVEAATLRGFRQMVAVIGDTAQTPSIALHAALGFRMVGTLVSVGFKHGRWLDTVLMQRALGPGDGATP